MLSSGVVVRLQVGALPFELRALECCLESLAASYDVLTTDLEANSYPLLDGMAQGVGARRRGWSEGGCSTSRGGTQ